MLICPVSGYLVNVWYLLESQSLSSNPLVFADLTIWTRIGVNSPCTTSLYWSCQRKKKCVDNAGPLNAFSFGNIMYQAAQYIYSSPHVWMQKFLKLGKKQIQATSLLNDTRFWWAGTSSSTACMYLLITPNMATKTCDTFWVGIVWGDTILLSVLTYANVHWQCICSEAQLTSRASNPFAKAAAVIWTLPSSLAYILRSCLDYDVVVFMVGQSFSPIGRM